jgi:hypothetical protein
MERNIVHMFKVRAFRDIGLFNFASAKFPCLRPRTSWVTANMVISNLKKKYSEVKNVIIK